jgi:uncharacterized membrane protein YbhN (UPF0104 family)
VTTTSPDKQRATSRSAVLHWLRPGASVLILLAVIDYLLLPQIAGTEAALRLLRTVNPWGAAAAIAAEIASLVSYSLLTRSMLPDQRPRFSSLFRSDVTALGVSHLLRGGAATSGALRYRLLQQGGAPAGDAAVGIAVEGCRVDADARDAAVAGPDRVHPAPGPPRG